MYNKDYNIFFNQNCLINANTSTTIIRFQINVIIYDMRFNKTYLLVST